MLHYCLLFGIVGSGGNPLVASTVGFVFGAILNHWLNYYYTFCSTASYAGTLMKFLAIACVGLMINTTAMILLIGIAHIHYMAAQLAATGGVVVWNFSANVFWTFRQN
jgi:putative flippase GtrA